VSGSSATGGLVTSSPSTPGRTGSKGAAVLSATSSARKLTVGKEVGNAVGSNVGSNVGMSVGRSV